MSDNDTQISSAKLRQIGVSRVDTSSKEFVFKYINAMVKNAKTPEMRSYWSMIYKWVEKELNK